MSKTKNSLAKPPKNTKIITAAIITSALLALGAYSRYDRPSDAAISAVDAVASRRDEIRLAFRREKYDSTARARIERARGEPMGGNPFGTEWTVSVSSDGEFFRVGMTGLSESQCLELLKSKVEGAVDPIILEPLGRPIANGQLGCAPGPDNAVEWMFR
jgi:hypothetical protein